MAYSIEDIRYYVRVTQPARFPSALGKAARSGEAPVHVVSPIFHVRIELRDASGATTFGCAADRLSVRWLDKRPGRATDEKRRELVELIKTAGEIYRSVPEFDSPFQHWFDCHGRIVQAGRNRRQEDLSSAFASSLMERAVLDGVCRLADKSLFDMVKGNQLGFDPGVMHPILQAADYQGLLPDRPVQRIHVRHTVGLYDPLTEEDWPPQDRLNDGLPETLKDYIDAEGIRYFKVKISGDLDFDLARLARIWEIMPLESSPVITLDANEAFEDLRAFYEFVVRLEREQLGLSQHVLYIEQPLPRRVALEPEASRWIRRVSEIKDVIIDESDANIDSCRRALDMGYAGTSHKNCKGFFKSLANQALTAHFSSEERPRLISAEDLQNLPVVPLHQDFVSVGILGLDHCERNGHHYNFGLSMLSETDKSKVSSRHPDLYEQRGGEWFMKIEQGSVQCASLHGPGFGIQDEPDWESMATV